jgi:uncharacterized protein (DUF1800 family)
MPASVNPPSEVAVSFPSGTDPLAGPAAAQGAASSLRRALAVLGGVALTACGGSGDGAAAAYAYLAPESDADAARFLQQAQFASTPADMASLRSGRYADWLNRQLDLAPGPTGWAWLESQGYGVVDSNGYYASTTPADHMIWNQLLSGADPVRRRMALALSEFFVVSMTGASFNWRSHAMAHYWDTLVRHAFGNFRELLEAVSLHPAMGFFLNTKGNQKENPAKGRVPDENYAREVMQLFTIGLYRLDPDGSVQTDGSGKPLESYTQDDVTNLARVFTGYDFDKSDGVRLTTPSGGTIESKDFARKPMLLDPARHSALAATFLGTTIPANAPGEVALERAMDTLFKHPNVGPFFARQMIQRLVTSDPSPAYVARVAARFNDNGQGVRGDLRAVWAAILLDDEARAPRSPSDIRFGRLREPMVRLVQWAHSFGLRSSDGTWKLGDMSAASSRLGQSPLRAPSVFNFFRPGYVPPATAMADDQATAPEFQLVNETSVGGYLNYLQSVIRNGLSADMQAAYTAEWALVNDATALVRHINLVLCAGRLSPATQTLMIDAVSTGQATSTASDTYKLNRIAAVVFMAMASAEYLIQQ